MPTWKALPPELTLRILQFVFAGKKVTFRRSNTTHDTTLLSVLTVSKTFVDRDVVIGAMLESVDVVLDSVMELYKMGTYLISYDKSALRHIVTPNCEGYPRVGHLSLQEIKGIFASIKVIDFGDQWTKSRGMPSLNVSHHSMLYALSMQAADDSVLFAARSLSPKPAKATSVTFNFEEECRKGYLNMREASTLMVAPWKRRSQDPRMQPQVARVRKTCERDAWQKSLLIHGKDLQVEIKFWQAIDIEWGWRRATRHSVSVHRGSLMV